MENKNANVSLNRARAKGMLLVDSAPQDVGHN